MNKPELLLPAGTPEALKTAFLYGADAVYAGVPGLSLRARSGFDEASLSEAVKYVHSIGKKIYLTLNLFSRNDDVPRLDGFAGTVRDLAPDGLIVSDPGVFIFMRERLPSVPLHVSTQANVGSWLTVGFWRDLGAKVCVLSRETPFKDIAAVKARFPDMKVEMFVHGSMCMSYSGRCLLSAFMTGRSANRGVCAHSCRWEYRLYAEERTRKGAFLPVEEDERGTYVFNSKDLCLMPRLDRILAAGIDILKVEGRNKTPYYVASVARAYRKAIDDWFAAPDKWSPDPYQAELNAVQNRGYTTGFFDGVPGAEAQNYETAASDAPARNAGVVRAHRADGLELTLFHKVATGDTIFLLPPDGSDPVPVVLDSVIDGLTGETVPVLSPGKTGQSLFIPKSLLKSFSLDAFPEFTVARKDI